MTNGDYYGIQDGYIREGEAVEGQTTCLGNSENNLIFLGYPDGYLDHIFYQYTQETDQLVTYTGQSITYGNRGLGRSDYHTYRFGHPAPYNLYYMMMDLRQIIIDFRPDQIFTTSEFETHHDHSITCQVIQNVLSSLSVKSQATCPHFTRHSYMGI